MSDLTSILAAQAKWSASVFGPGPRTEGNCRHIEKELAEVRANPTDLYEWIDIAMLAFDGAWRAGHSPAEIEAAYRAKLSKNIARIWPEPNGQDAPVEHVK